MKAYCLTTSGEENAYVPLMSTLKFALPVGGEQRLATPVLSMGLVCLAMSGHLHVVLQRQLNVRVTCDRYGHAVSLRQLIGEELMQRAASLQRGASLQREASLRRTASGALRADPGQHAPDAKLAGYVQ